MNTFMIPKIERQIKIIYESESINRSIIYVSYTMYLRVHALSGPTYPNSETFVRIK